MKYPIKDFIITDKVKKRFLKRIDKQGKNGCWIWKGSLTGRAGYGAMNIDGKMIRTHRISYQLHIGIIPKDMYILHECDNPKCCNPLHLFVGTDLDNARDKMKKGRCAGGGPIGEKNGNAKLTDKQTREILIKYKSDNYTQKQLGEIYKVDQSQISYIVNRE